MRFIPQSLKKKFLKKREEVLSQNLNYEYLIYKNKKFQSQNPSPEIFHFYKLNIYS
jgi:hypothetical protein